MSQFHKLLLTVLGASIGVYFFTCSTFSVFNQKTQPISQEQLINYVNQELEYELTLGDKNVDQESFIKQTIQKRLQKNN
jgi:hypothetical protein